MKLDISKELLINIEKEISCKISSIEELGNGDHNVNYLLNTNIGKFVLRIYANTQFNNARNEFDLLKKLKGKYSPKVYFIDESKSLIKYNYIIQEFIEGKVLEKFDDENIVRVAELLKKIHQISNENKKEENWISNWTKDNILNNSKYLEEELSSEIIELYNLVSNRLEKIKPLIKNYKKNTLIHNDIIPANIIEKEDKTLVFIDWELSVYDYFFVDFGSIFVECNLSDDLKEKFLLAYGFGLNENEKEIVNVISMSRSLGAIAWFIERFSSIKQGNDLFEFGDIKRYEKLLKEHIVQIRKLFY